MLNAVARQLKSAFQDPAPTGQFRSKPSHSRRISGNQSRCCLAASHLRLGGERDGATVSTAWSDRRDSTERSSPLRRRDRHGRGRFLDWNPLRPGAVSTTQSSAPSDETHAPVARHPLNPTVPFTTRSNGAATTVNSAESETKANISRCEPSPHEPHRNLHVRATGQLDPVNDIREPSRWP